MTWPRPSSGWATSWSATGSRRQEPGSRPLYSVGVAHTHSHSHSLAGPSPLGPLAARIVVGLLVAIGLAVIVGAGVLWPSHQKVDIPLPFQNAAGGAVTTEAGHVLFRAASPTAAARRPAAC